MTPLDFPSKWIPVSESLPELTHVILFCVTGREMCEMGWLTYDEPHRWQSVETAPCDEPIYFDMEQVTHWMPLPPPPEAK